MFSCYVAAFCRLSHQVSFQRKPSLLTSRTSHNHTKPPLRLHFLLLLRHACKKRVKYLLQWVKRSQTPENTGRLTKTSKLHKYPASSSSSSSASLLQFCRDKAASVNTHPHRHSEHLTLRPPPQSRILGESTPGPKSRRWRYVWVWVKPQEPQ